MKPYAQIDTLANSDAVRKIQRDGRWLYSAVDIVALLSDSEQPAELWEDLKLHEPSIARWIEHDAEQD